MSSITSGQIDDATVFRGKDDFLFFTDHEVMEQITGEYPLTPDQVKTWVTRISDRYDWCVRNNAKLCIIIIPEKHVVYNDHIEHVTVSHNRPVMQIIDALPEHLKNVVHYPLNEFLRAKEKKHIFYKTDTHYTSETGFMTYNIIMKLVGDLEITPVTSEDTKLVHSYRVGDLGARLNPNEGEDVCHVHHGAHLPFQRIYDNELYKRGNTVVFKSPRVDAPKALIFRDSFFTYIMPHVVPVFSRTVAVCSIDMHYDVANAEKPDVIIFQLIERFVANNADDGERILPKDPSSGFEDFSGISASDLAAIVD